MRERDIEEPEEAVASADPAVEPKIGRSLLMERARADRREEEAAMTPLERVKLALRLGLYTRELERRARRLGG